MSKPLPKTSAPASRALAGRGIQSLDDLSRFGEAEILALHGMGPKAMGILREALRENGLKFKEQATVLNPPSEQQTPAQVLGFVHVAIAVSDLNHQIEFWQQVLGFKLDGVAEIGGPLPEAETGVPGLRSKLAMLSKGGLSVELYQPLAPAERQTYRPTPADIGSWHLALKVSGLDELIRCSGEWGWQVRGKVAVVEEGPGPVGARLVYLHNDDGTILELVELP